MAGVVPADGRDDRPAHPRLPGGDGWPRRRRSARPGPWLRGHEFHYSTVDPAGDALVFRSRFGERPDGFATPTLLATYLHHHPGGDPSAVARFVDTCRQRRNAALPYVMPYVGPP